ncbi:MAG: hypothetical protein K2Y31_09315 [Burkholderiales bacterium]|nr:hypothetical protein [Burkholderiales bacterium]
MALLLLPAAQAQIGVRAAAQGISAAAVNIGYGGVGTFVTRTTAGSITPGFPAGTAAGDLLITQVVAREDAATITMPGWNQLFTDTPVADYQVKLYWRVATGADTNTVTQAGTSNLLAARMTRFTGVDTNAPILNAGTVSSPVQLPAANSSNQNQAYIRTGTETTTAANAMLVILAFSADDSAPAAPPAGCGTDAAFTTLTLAYSSTTTAGRDGSIWSYYGLQTAAGATGPFCQGKSAGADQNHGVLIALNPAPASNVTINVPAGTLNDDVMIASITWRPCSAISGAACTTSVAPPAGWTVVDAVDQTTGGASGQRLVVYRRVAAAEPASYTWTFGGAPLHAGAVGGIVSFSGVDTGNPIVASLGQATASSTSHIANQINTGVVTNTMLVTSHGANSATVWNAVAGMTEQVDASSVAVPNDVGIALAMNTELRAAAGLTGSRTATFTSPPAADTGVTHMLALRPGINHFSITHAGSGVACDVHTITLTAHSATHTAVNANSLAVSLSTTNGRGTWTGIVSGGGTLTGVGAGNGLATYTFAAGSSTAQLSFRYANLPGTSDIFGFNAVSGVISETSGAAIAADDPLFTMAQAGFRFRNITDSTDTIPTQISGKPSNDGFNAKTIRLQAIRTDTASLACVAGFPAAATRNIEMGAECNSPGSCAGSSVSITSNAITTAIPTSADNSAAGASNYYATGGGVPLLFNANSEADIVITYPDAGQISLHARFDLDTGVAGYEMLGSSNLFVVRPFGLAFRGANSGAVVQHGTTDTATLLAAAGDNFTMTVAAYQWASGEDANNDGVPDAGVNITDNGAVPNFAATATVSSSANLAGVAGTVSRGVPGACASAATTALSAGAATAADWCYSEVGNVFLTATVNDYITAGINIAGNSGLDGTGAAGGYVGRFRPKRFAVSGAVRTNRTVAACAPASVFTYMDEALTLAFTLTAQNTLGATTQNYTSTYARLDPTAGSNNAKQVFGIGARNVSPFAALTARVSAGYVTSAPVWSNGVLNVTGGNAALVTVARPTPDDPPDGPYAQVQFGIAPTDSDGVLMAAYDLDVDNSAGNDHTLTGATTEVRYGRMRLGGASGSQLLPLRVPVEAQYWNGTFWVTNVDDNCTTLVAGNVGLGNYIGNLGAGETTATITASPLQAGRSAIRLSAPGVGNNGSVDVALNLGASPAAVANACPAFAPSATAGNKAYLRGKWCGTTAIRDPAARARFGIMRSSDEAIYTRENTN